MHKRRQKQSPALPVAVERVAEGAALPAGIDDGINRGVQGYRRGDTVVYTVRGDPEEVVRLVQELKKWGVPEVVALVSHQTSASDGSKTPKQLAQAAAQDSATEDAQG
ncbi:MAG TPA: hypothetical protein PL033_09595 [Candidatus Brocadiia bacterium]|nr:hypothetical protein [Candidatus Brocadiia bacterium]